MSVILWIAMLSYLTVAVVFNLMMLSFYKEEKEITNSPWSGNEDADKLGMFIASVCWPICVLYGLFKMKKEEKNK